MTLRQASGRPRAAGLLGIALVALLLPGCTSAFLTPGGVGPVATETASPEPTPTADAPEPDPSDEPDCVHLLIDRPGNYAIGECATVTLEGTGIHLAFGAIDQLVIRGDGSDVIGDTLGSVEIQGQGADVTAYSIDDLLIRGEDNIVVVESTIGAVNVQGNGNTVTATGGIQTPPVDNGLLNEIG